MKTKLLYFYEKYMLAMGLIGQLLFYTQAFKIFHNHSAHDVSVYGFLLGLVSVASWLIYGILIKNRVLLLSNIFAFIGALLVILGIWIYA